jgi:hypothetical protein
LLSSDFASKLLGDCDTFRRKLVDTRDFYTHLGILERSSAVTDPNELFLLNQRLRAFLRCVLLIDLGVPQSLLEGPIMYQATRWKVW